VSVHIVHKKKKPLLHFSTRSVILINCNYHGLVNLHTLCAFWFRYKWYNLLILWPLLHYRNFQFGIISVIRYWIFCCTRTESNRWGEYYWKEVGSFGGWFEWMEQLQTSGLKKKIFKSLNRYIFLAAKSVVITYHPAVTLFIYITLCTYNMLYI